MSGREYIIDMMKRLQIFRKCSYKDNARTTLNQIFSSEMMSEINLKGNYNEIFITERKYETFTKVRKIQLQRSNQNYIE